MSFLNQIKKGQNPELKETVYKNIRNPQEPHLPFILLLDGSTSMGELAGLKTKIRLLNEAVKRLKEEMMMDELAASRVDIAVIAYGDSARVICDWTPISEFEAPQLNADGWTAMGEAGCLAFEMLKERRRFYRAMGTPSYAGYVYNITDGCATDDVTAVTAMIKAEEAKGYKAKVKWFNCAVPGADEQALVRMSKRSIAVEETRFDTLFNWIGASMALVSNSNPEEVAALPDLPENIRKIDPDWY